ncbi:MAG: HAD family phosphatase [Planctomycetes bacterium]|nr:HAD family phosphatase [Planctomycetota bacterium]MCB9917912.1 HAD family phosphatase [Planctomycetota bacterium]
MDGVLIDAKDWHYEALNEALALFGHKIRRSEHLETYDGLPTKTKLRMLSKERELPEGLHDFINEMKQAYTIDIAWRNCRPTFSHEYALARLASEGYRIAVCSNSVRQSIEMMLSKAALIEHVDLIVSNQDVTRPKPDPEMYSKAVTEFGLNPSECLVVEDNPNGIQAATAAGCHVLVVDDVHEVQYTRIQERIRQIETAGAPQTSENHESPHPALR